MASKPFNRKCKNCGESYDTGDFRKVYCSPKCKIEYCNAQRSTSQLDDRECVVCGTIFKPMQIRGVGRKWCSNECRLATLKWYKPEKRKKEAKEAERKRKACLYTKQWIEKHGGNRALSLLKDYKLTVEQYDEILKSQNGVCAICGMPESAKKKDGTPRNLAVDHCHKKGHIRKLLCTNCNTGIGCFKDNTELLLKAIKYIESFNGD